MNRYALLDSDNEENEPKNALTTDKKKKKEEKPASTVAPTNSAPPAKNEVKTAAPIPGAATDSKPEKKGKLFRNKLLQMQ